MPEPTEQECKAAADESARAKLEWMQAEYWRARNGKQEYMRCPYCFVEVSINGALCCDLFAKAFAAILDRQDKVDGLERFRLLAEVTGAISGSIN